MAEKEPGDGYHSSECSGLIMRRSSQGVTKEHGSYDWMMNAMSK